MRYSEGFSPHALLAFGNALPTGAASLAEYVDIRLDAAEVVTESPFGVEATSSESDLAAFAAILNERTPPGLSATAVGHLDGSEKSLQEAVACVRWELVVSGLTHRELEDRIQRALSASVLSVERKGQTVTDDIRSNIESLQLSGTDLIEAELLTQPRGIRPMELLRVIDPALALIRATRTHQWIDGPTGREEPLRAGEFATTSRLAAK
jgi:radical SAM-linked protein